MVAERHQPPSERLHYLSSLLPKSWAEHIAPSIIQIVSNAIKPIIYSWELLIFTYFLFLSYSFITSFTVLFLSLKAASNSLI